MHSVEFFDAQFRRQVRDQEFALNPFETLALEHLRGSVLDLGSGLGNLSLEAARRGHAVVAVDGSRTAIERIRAASQREGLPVQALEADLGTFALDRSFDTIVAIGILMFFRRERAHELLCDIQQHVHPGGRAIVNVLIEGTTFLGMFEPGHYHLFGARELEEHFAGWRILESSQRTFAAPNDQLKVFATVVAEKPMRVD